MAEAVVAAAEGHGAVALQAVVGPSEPAWECPLPWLQGLEAIDERPDLLIDFTLPEGTERAALWCAERRVPLLSGVTGIPEKIREQLVRTAGRVPVLWSPNLSLGVNLLAELVGRAAAVLDPDVPVHILDVHHRWKKDAPSGTALMLGERVSEGRAGQKRGIEFDSVREGEVIGEHTVRFDLVGEELALVHRARDRSIYARGALDAGEWLLGQPAGLYEARDWLAGRIR
jgi:4-hydroxy-tetrahydrodipicolinate reductase